MGLIPVTTLLVPVVFTLREGFPRLLMVRVDPTLVTNANARPAGRGGMEQDGGDPGAWISEVVAPQLRGATLTSRFHPLLPRPMRGGRLAIPAWTTARTDAGRGDGLELVDAAAGLDRIGNELGDPDFGRQVLAAVRATLASDPFAQRVMGDGVRLNALSSDRLSGDPAAMLPAVVALLPRTFTLAELREAIAATLGVHPRDFDFGSGFRRRIQEFVLSRVLREVGSTRDLPDFGSDGPAVGRPARRYEFDADAWRMWLRDRGERGAGPGSRTAFAPREDVIAGNVATPAPARMPAPPRDDSPALRPLHARSRKAPPEQPTEDEGRIARLERMVERLARELGKGRQPE